MYNLLKQKYDMTTSQKLIFKKHKYIKKEYIIKLLKNNNIILNKDESYNKIANEILKKKILNVMFHMLMILLKIEL